MRIVNEIIHPQCRITVFHWNNKYLLKFEKDLIEQTYKVPDTEVSGDEDISRIINSGLMEKVLLRFQEMQQDLLQTLNDMYQ